MCNEYDISEMLGKLGAKDLCLGEGAVLPDVQVGDKVLLVTATDKEGSGTGRESKVITTTDDKLWITHKNGAPYGPWLKANGRYGGDGFPGLYRRIVKMEGCETQPNEDAELPSEDVLAEAIADARDGDLNAHHTQSEVAAAMNVVLDQLDELRGRNAKLRLGVGLGPGENLGLGPGEDLRLDEGPDDDIDDSQPAGDGGPAYPQPLTELDDGHMVWEQGMGGMSFEDAVAIRVLPELIRDDISLPEDEQARAAYDYAEAMVRERKERG